MLLLEHLLQFERLEIITNKEVIIINANIIATTTRKITKFTSRNNHLKLKMERTKKRWTNRKRLCTWPCLNSTRWAGTSVRNISLSPSLCSWTRRNPCVKNVFPCTLKKTSRNRRRARTRMRPDKLKTPGWLESKLWLSTLIRLK